jgi:hypothetical protein
MYGAGQRAWPDGVFMGLRSPQSFFRFAAEHYRLLEDLLTAEEVNDGDLVHLIERHRSESTPQTDYLIGQLLEFGLLERLPDASGYEMPLPVADFLRWLRQEHHLTSIQQIQGYVAELDALQQELDAVIRGGRLNGALLLLDEISRKIEQIRQDVAGNQQAIVNEVMRHRANREHAPLKERYGTILRLWERFLVPMRALIDTTQPMQHQFDSLSRVLLSGEQAAAGQALVEQRFSQTRKRLIRMRGVVAQHFLQAMSELQPLHQHYQRQSRLARGASVLLETVGKRGVDALGLVEAFAIPVFRREAEFNQVQLEAYLWEVAAHNAAEEVRLGSASAPERRERISPLAIRRELAAAGPVPDALEWLLQRLPDASTAEVLRCFGDAIRYLPGTPQTQVRRYCHGSTILKAVPWALNQSEENHTGG